MAILKYINIKAPKTLNDLRIKHLKALTNEKYQKAMDLGTIIEFICLITGAKRNDLNKVNISELRNIHEHCIGLFKDFQLSKPKEEITINGVTYLLVDPAKVCQELSPTSVVSTLEVATAFSLASESTLGLTAVLFGIFSPSLTQFPQYKTDEALEEIMFLVTLRVVSLTKPAVWFLSLSLLSTLSLIVSFREKDLAASLRPAFENLDIPNVLSVAVSNGLLEI